MTCRFTDPTWQQEYRLLVCPAREAEKKLSIDISPDTDGVTMMMDNGAIAIWTREGADSDVLVHECVHAGMFALDRAGVEGNDTETLAYIVQAIWRQC